MRMQVLLLIPMVIGVLIVGIYFATGGDLPGDWPWEEHRAEIRVKISRSIFGGLPNMEITEVNTSKGGAWSLGPLFFAADYDLRVSAYREGKLLDSKTVGVSVGLGSSETVTVKWLGLGDDPQATIRAQLYYDGEVEAEDELTI